MTEPLIRHTCARLPPSQSAKTRLLQLILVQPLLGGSGDLVSRVINKVTILTITYTPQLSYL